ncbi:MAG: metal-dependent hydrolase [Thermoflexales bacterium]
MKGIAHFASGLCAATFIPGVVEQAINGGVLIALGGAAAMLPDFLDFRFARFLEHRDADIAPDPDRPDPKALANAIAIEICRARDEHHPRVIQLHPTRRSIAEWITYRVAINQQRGEVVVKLGDAEASANCGPLAYGYDGELDIIELGGPSLKLVPDAKGRVALEFLPWHRTWSHSFVLALVVGLCAAAVWGDLAGVVAGLGFALHIMEDQLGYLGSNLFWPFTRQRTQGLRLMHAVDPIPNFVTVWVSLTLMLLNLDRAASTPIIDVGPYLALVVAAPSLILLAIYAYRKWRNAVALEISRQRDAVGDAEPPQL